MNNKVIAVIALVAIIIVSLTVFKAAATKTEAVSTAVSQISVAGFTTR